MVESFPSFLLKKQVRTLLCCRGGSAAGLCSFPKGASWCYSRSGQWGTKAGGGRSPGFPLEEQQQHGEKGKGEKKFSKTNMGRSRAGGGTGAQEQLGAGTLRRTPLILELRDGGTERAVSAAGGGAGAGRRRAAPPLLGDTGPPHSSERGGLVGPGRGAKNGVRPGGG